MQKRALLLWGYILLLMTLPLDATVKIMPLGDSITWDWYYGDTRPDSYRSGYRNHLWYKLQDAGYDVDFVGSRHNGDAVTPPYDGDNEGYYGWTSYQIANSVYSFLHQNTPDIILLHIGTNDSVYFSPSSGVAGVESILDEIKRFEADHNKKIKVIIAKVINLSKAPTWISSFNAQLDSMIRQRTDYGEDLILVDMQNAVGWNLIDGIHPNTTGYQIMAAEWFNALQPLLESIRLQKILPLVPLYQFILE